MRAEVWVGYAEAFEGGEPRTATSANGGGGGGMKKQIADLLKLRATGLGPGYSSPLPFTARWGRDGVPERRARSERGADEYNGTGAHASVSNKQETG